MKNKDLDKQATAVMSQWQLIRLRFSRHKLAMAALLVLAVLYTLGIFAEFFAPYLPNHKNIDFSYCPPHVLRFNLTHGLHAYRLTRHTDPISFQKTYIIDKENIIRAGFFVPGQPYRLWGAIPLKRHFFGVAGVSSSSDTAPPPSPLYVLGADKYGRDILSRMITGARISLSIGLVGISITFLLGLTIGGISGYMGGTTDLLIQRLIEIMTSFPRLPLWLALAAIMPGDWSALQVYFAITLVLSLLNWPRLARVVRGKILALREEDYSTAARLLGAGHLRILFRHLLPGFTSHIIVTLTLSIPRVILGETSLSFLGLGIRPPIVSWGVMLQDCMDMKAVRFYPWLLIPVVFIIVTVLSFNFMGDGLRDAADPYSSK